VEELIRRADLATRSFSIEKDVLLSLIDLGEQRAVLCEGSQERYGLSERIEDIIYSLEPMHRWELMNLMYFGRNIDYYGFGEEAVADLEDHMRNPERGSSDPKYLMGKTPLGKWLRMALEILPSSFGRRIRYYIYEIEMPPENRRQLIEIAVKEHVSVDELFSQGIAYSIEHPEDLKAWKENFYKLPEDERERLNRIRLVRVYPVEEGQTDEEARILAIREEKVKDETL